MSHSTLSGRLPATNLDENNVVKFESRKYPSYDSLMKDLELWRTINFVQLTRRNCPLLKPHEIIEAEVGRVSSELRFECIHYGEPRLKDETNGTRPKQKLNAIGCKMFLHYKWFNGNWYLHNSNLNHLNHPTTKEHWDSHPNQRRVTSEERAEALKMFRLHVPFRDLKREMKLITGKFYVLISRDKSNFYRNYLWFKGENL